MKTKLIFAFCALASSGCAAFYFFGRQTPRETVKSDSNLIIGEPADQPNQPANGHFSEKIANVPPPPPPAPPKDSNSAIPELTEPVAEQVEKNVTRQGPENLIASVELQKKPSSLLDVERIVTREDLPRVSISAPFDAVVGKETIGTDSQTIKNINGFFEGEVSLLAGGEPMKLEINFQLKPDGGAIKGNSFLRLNRLDGSNISSVNHKGTLSFLKKGSNGLGEVVFTDLGPITKDVSQDLVVHAFQIFFDGSSEVIGNYYRRGKDGLRRAGTISLQRVEQEAK